jgi:hypothetical protein|tara:strand:- start:2450 stop:3049 length:600 start_codon:yes stop_codon:yes gene_type:complete
MNKKEFTKKQLKKQLTVLTEETVNPDIKSELRKAFKALKTLKSMLVGHKSGDDTLSFSDLKKIKTAARNIEDIYEDMVDEELTKKEKDQEKDVEKKNEQSEGHGKMYNALQGMREEKVIKINESTLKRIIERVITENDDWMQSAEEDIEKRGTKGVFHEWCDKQGFDGGCDKKCWDAAIEAGGVWIKRAGLAKAFCESR